MNLQFSIRKLQIFNRGDWVAFGAQNLNPALKIEFPPIGGFLQMIFFFF